MVNPGGRVSLTTHRIACFFSAFIQGFIQDWLAKWASQSEGFFEEGDVSSLASFGASSKDLKASVAQSASLPLLSFQLLSLFSLFLLVAHFLHAGWSLSPRPSVSYWE